MLPVKKNMIESAIAEIEQTQHELRASIEASKVLTEQSEELIARHRSENPRPEAPQA